MSVGFLPTGPGIARAGKAASRAGLSASHGETPEEDEEGEEGEEGDEDGDVVSREAMEPLLKRRLSTIFSITSSFVDNCPRLCFLFLFLSSLLLFEVNG